MRIAFLLFTLCTLLLEASPRTNLEADRADYDGNKIRVEGAVCIRHEFGDIRCDKGVLLMKAGSEKRLDLDRILLYGAVEVVLQDGSVLTSDEADINCQTLEGVFTAAPPEKVTYLTRVEEDGQTVPVKTQSRAMRVQMKKQEGEKTQYVIHDVQAEGAVNIEYQHEK